MGKTDWNKLQKMTEQQKMDNALSDPDALPTSAAMWNNATVRMPDNEVKVSINIRVSPRVLDFFKMGGKGYQSRMNAVLEAYIEQELRQKDI